MRGLRCDGAKLYIWMAAVAAFLWALPAHADDAAWFDDVENHALFRHTRIDVAAPEPASFTALGVAPFVTAQALASADFAVSAAQILDDNGNPRGALGVDFTPWALYEKNKFTLGAYQKDRIARFYSRIQLSLAASKGESHDDHALLVAPSVRVVLHEQRDPRVHRGPGSLKDCFERHVGVLPEYAALRDVERKLAVPDLQSDTRTALEKDLPVLRSHYENALTDAIRLGMGACRDDPEVAAYTWNATGYALGFSPHFRTPHGLEILKLKGFATWATVSYGFDPRSTLPSYQASFLGNHAQILGQVMYRYKEPLPNPILGGALSDADQFIVSSRARAGTSKVAGNLEAAVIHENLDRGGQDTYVRFSTGADVHIHKSTWLSLSVGRTVGRDLAPAETVVRASIKVSVLD